MTNINSAKTEVITSNIQKIELLKQINKLYIYFNTPITLNNLQLSIKNGTILELALTNTPLHFQLPFKLELVNHSLNASSQILQVNFKKIKEDDELDLEDDLETLENLLSQDWNATDFLNVQQVLCEKCECPLIIREDEDTKAAPIVTTATTVGDSDITEVIENLSQLKISLDDAPKRLFKKLKNLPREGWEELIDCWTCHKEDFTPVINKVFLPDKDTLLVDSNYLLVNGKKVRGWKELKEGMGNEISKPMNCTSCNNYLGMVELRQNEEDEKDKEIKGVVKLHKLAVKISRNQKNIDNNNSQGIVIESKNFIKLILLNLCINNRYNAASRFIFKDWKTGRVILCLFVFNWQVYLWNRNDNNMNDDINENKNHLQHTLKCYIYYNKEENSTIIENWLNDDNIISLYYPKQLIIQFYNNLININTNNTNASSILFKNFDQVYLTIPS
ncbi:hypothetical protein K502DRAFT_345898 [Neoconidiobolus thromboides FSU 785]|nr:hypothetical protein K502DRAFT_345898 [Neoconidiobolus thromboides FSU 785]